MAPTATAYSHSEDEWVWSSTYRDAETATLVLVWKTDIGQFVYQVIAKFFLKPVDFNYYLLSVILRIINLLQAWMKVIIIEIIFFSAWFY